MLKRIEAVQYIQDTASGRTRPVIAVAEDHAGEVVEVVLKFASACDMGTNSLAVEVVAACLAARLGLPIPEPFLVEISPEWRASLPAAVRSRLSDFDTLAFGSKLLYPQWPAWTVANRLTPGMTQVAAEVLAFDGFIENMDRRDGNPNCLVSGDQIRIFDHELAFPRGLIGPKPWAIGGLQSFTQPGHHIFRRELVAKVVDYAIISQKWSGLQDDEIDEYGAAVPAEWRDDAFINDILNKIRQARDNIGGGMTELNRILQ